MNRIVETLEPLWWQTPRMVNGARGVKGSARSVQSATASPLKVLVAGNHAESLARVENSLTNELSATDTVIALSLSRMIDRAVQELPQRIVLLLDGGDRQGLDTLRELVDLGFEQILVIGPTDHAELILKVIQQGAYQYLGLDQINSELVPLLRRGGAAKQSEWQNAGQVISIVGTHGGCGASTCATNLALAMAREDSSVALIDLNLLRGDVAALLDLEAPHTIADLCQNAARMDRAMFDQCFVRHAGGIAALAAPRQIGQGGQVTPVGIRKVLNMAQMEFPFTLIDLPHTATDVERQVLLRSDRVLVVTLLDFTALRHTRRVLTYLQEIGIDETRIHLVVNRGNRPRELSRQEARRILERDARFWVPEDAKNVNYANNRGTPLVLTKPRSSAAKAIREIARELRGDAGSPVTSGGWFSSLMGR